MTIRYSNASATQILVYALQPGEQIGADTLPALAFGANEHVFIIEGSPKDLVAFAERVRAALPRCQRLTNPHNRGRLDRLYIVGLRDPGCSVS